MFSWAHAATSDEKRRNLPLRFFRAREWYTTLYPVYLITYANMQACIYIYSSTCANYENYGATDHFDNLVHMHKSTRYACSGSSTMLILPRAQHICWNLFDSQTSQLASRNMTAPTADKGQIRYPQHEQPALSRPLTCCCCMLAMYGIWPAPGVTVRLTVTPMADHTAHLPSSRTRSTWLIGEVHAYVSMI